MSTTEAHARTGDPETSHEAAASVHPFTMRRLHAVQLNMLGIVTDTHQGMWIRYQMLQPSLDWPKTSESGFRTRVSELVAAGLAADSGHRQKLPSGRRAVLWSITSTGWDALHRLDSGDFL
jgi:hypothetical protein